jgi:RimJ/RimL family protein N-acetyltransferase
MALEVGYSILSSYQGKGYASEATKKCRDYAFFNNFSSSLISIIHPENTGSKEVAQNNG